MSKKGRAQEVLQLLETGSYQTETQTVDIEAAQAAAVAGSRLYTPARCEELRAGATPGTPEVLVVDGTSQVVAQRLASDGPLLVLNFASARNPGGGFLNGAKAQEEDLCRCSGLYPTLLEHPTYYRVNRAQKSMLYTDHTIYSPRVPFFRTAGTGPLLEEPFLASVVSAPAPNTAPHLARHPGDVASLEAAFERRWRNVLAIARHNDERVLLLGAWGCGAFGGDPVMAATTAKRALAAEGAFDRVVFAIPGRGKKSAHNLAIFAEILAG